MSNQDMNSILIHNTSSREDDPRVRAVLLGTHDQNSVLHKLRAQQYLLQKILPRTCTCLRIGGTHFESSACVAAQHLERLAADQKTQIGERTSMRQRVTQRFQQCCRIRDGYRSRTITIAHSLRDELCSRFRISKARALDALPMILCVGLLLSTAYLHMTVGLMRLGTPLLGACGIIVAIFLTFTQVEKRFGRCIPRGFGNSGEHYLGHSVPIAAVSVAIDFAVRALYQVMGVDTSMLEAEISWTIAIALSWILGWCTLFHLGFFTLTGDTEGYNWFVPSGGLPPLVVGLSARVVIPLDNLVRPPSNSQWDLCNGYLWCVMIAMAVMWRMLMRCNDNLVIMQAIDEDNLCRSSVRRVLARGHVVDQLRMSHLQVDDGACVVYPTILSFPKPDLLPCTLARQWLRLITAAFW